MTVARLALNGHGSVVVQALNEAITATMNEFGGRHGCAPLHWYLREVNGFDRGDVIGFPGGPSEQSPTVDVRVAEVWARVLGLAERDDEVAGYRSWTGTAGTSRIEIWCRT
jgi:hypothetical protein